MYQLWSPCLTAWRMPHSRTGPCRDVRGANYSLAFEAQLALAAIKGGESLAELVQLFNRARSFARQFGGRA
jgi:hypothetical protein